MTQKQCTKCKAWKFLAEFGNHKRYKDGKRYWCKACTAQYMKTYFQTKRGKDVRARAMRRHRPALDKLKGNRRAAMNQRLRDLLEDLTPLAFYGAHKVFGGNGFADDWAQTALLNAWKFATEHAEDSIDQLRKRVKSVIWFSLRREASRKDKMPGRLPEDVENSREDHGFAQVDADDLTSALLGSLGPDTQDVVVLRLEGYSKAEIGRQLGVSRERVRQRLQDHAGPALARLLSPSCASPSAQRVE